MPYIKQYMRDEFDDLIGEMEPETAGELNYIFTMVALQYLKQPGKGNYQSINDIVGALEGAKLEFYRRYASIYEDGKIKENGDVY